MLIMSSAVAITPDQCASENTTTAQTERDPGDGPSFQKNFFDKFSWLREIAHHLSSSSGYASDLLQRRFDRQGSQTLLEGIEVLSYPRPKEARQSHARL